MHRCPSVSAFSLQACMHLAGRSLSLKWAGGGPASAPSLHLSLSFSMWNAASIHGAELSLIDLSVKAKRHTQSTTMQFSLSWWHCPPQTPKGAWVTLRDSSAGIKNEKTFQSTNNNKSCYYYCNTAATNNTSVKHFFASLMFFPSEIIMWAGYILLRDLIRLYRDFIWSLEGGLSVHGSQENQDCLPPHTLFSFMLLDQEAEEDK